MSDKGTFTIKELAWGFNEWNRRFVENPDEFLQQFTSLKNFQEDDDGDNNSSLEGHLQAAYLVSLITE